MKGAERWAAGIGAAWTELTPPGGRQLARDDTKPGATGSRLVLSCRSDPLKTLEDTSNPLHDRELLARAQQGDREAFETLVRPHSDGLRRFAFSLTRSWQDADDIAQDTLLRAFRAIAKFDERSSLSTWLHVVARNACADWHRNQMAGAGRHEPLVSSHPADGEANDDAAANKQEAGRLWTALQQLDERSRVPLVLFELDGMSYDEIAAQEGVPVGTIRSRLSRARKHLRELVVKQEKRAGSGVYPRVEGAPSQGDGGPLASRR